MKIESKTMEYDAVKLLRSTNYGILSTMSKTHQDYPFGSFVTYASSRSRTIHLYLSNLAEHTENLHYKSESCITIFKTNLIGDKQNSKRLTLMGDLKKVPENMVNDCKQRFLQILPESKKYEEMHDFNFYKLEIKHARWIGGFGNITWLNEDAWSDYQPEWVKDESRILEHMNNDHSKNIISSLYAQHEIKDENAKMVLLTIDGYYTLSESGVYFIQFPEICNTMLEFKDALVKLANEHKDFELKS